MNLLESIVVELSSSNLIVDTLQKDGDKTDDQSNARYNHSDNFYNEKDVKSLTEYSYVTPWWLVLVWFTHIF